MEDSSGCRRGCLWILAIPVGLLLLIMVGTSISGGVRHYRAASLMAKVADQLGYVESVEFYRGRNQFDGWIHAANYSLELAFATPLTTEEVPVALASAFTTIDQDPVYYSRFDAFLVDGQLGWDDEMVQHDREYAQAWTIKNEDGSSATVTLLETASLNHFVTRRQQLVRSNILFINVYIGTISNFAIPYHYWAEGNISLYSDDRVTANSPIELLTHGAQPIYKPGAPLTIMAALARDTQLVMADALTATLIGPGGTTTPMTITDRSATRYRMNAQSLWAVTGLAPAVAGRYHLQVTAAAGDQHFAHTEPIYIVPPPDFVAALQVVGEQTLNLDQDDLAEALTFRLYLAVTTPGHYRVDGILAGAAGERRTIHATAYLATGVDAVLPYTDTITLRYDSADLWGLGAEGVYTLTAVTVSGSTVISTAAGLALPTLYQHDWVEELPLDYATALYPPNTFEAPAPLQSPAVDNSSRQVLATNEALADLNDDGLFDRLTISVTLDRAVTGDLFWAGELIDNEGMSIAHIYTKTPVTATQTIPFVFAGSAVAALERPTFLTFQLYDQRRPGRGERLSTDLLNLHQTRMLQPLRFTRSSLLWAEEEPIDRDQDGLLEALTIRLQPDLLYSGQYEVSIQVADREGRSVTRVEDQRLWSLADPIVITIPGKQLINGKHEGPYQVSELRVTKPRDDNTFFRFTDLYRTQAYQPTQFERAE